MQHLSKRLHKIIETVRPCHTAVDVGCDHGYAAIELVKSGKALKAVAADINEGPLMGAKENIARTGLLEQVSLCLSDGLRSIELPAETDRNALVIAGMGGALMRDILKGVPTNGLLEGEAAAKHYENRARSLLRSMQQLILSPQSEPELVRHYILDVLGKSIQREYTLLDEGKYYVILDVDMKGTGSPYPHAWQYRFGAVQDDSTKAVYKAYLLERRQKTEAALLRVSKLRSEKAEERRRALDAELLEIEAALSACGRTL